MFWLIPAGLQAVGTIVKTNSANAQNNQQLALNRYNANAQYKVNMGNVHSQYALGQANAAMMMASAGMQSGIAAMQRQAGLDQGAMMRGIAAFNANTVLRTTMYNNELLDEELSLMWEAADLDLLHLENQRAVERGQIVGQQAASGTVIGQGSNRDVVVDQRTQEAMDAMIIRHNADIAASRIRNKQAQNGWQGMMEGQKIMWEGEMGALITEHNALMQSFSTQAGAISTAMQGMVTSFGAEVSKQAGTQSALIQQQAGLYGAQAKYDMNSNQIRSNFITGMFGAASSGVSGYFAQKQPTINWGQLFNKSSPTSNPASTLVTSNQLAPSPTAYKFASGYERGFSLADQGSSLFGN